MFREKFATLHKWGRAISAFCVVIKFVTKFCPQCQPHCLHHFHGGNHNNTSNTNLLLSTKCFTFVVELRFTF